MNLFEIFHSVFHFLSLSDKHIINIFSLLWHYALLSVFLMTTESSSVGNVKYPAHITIKRSRQVHWETDGQKAPVGHSKYCAAASMDSLEEKPQANRRKHSPPPSVNEEYSSSCATSFAVGQCCLGDSSISPQLLGVDSCTLWTSA